MTHTQKHTVNTNLEALMHAQSIFDYHLEMGGNIEDLRSELAVEIKKLSDMISLRHTHTDEMLSEHLPMMTLWCEALEQLNWFEQVQGCQEAGVIGLNYIRCAWGLELDLEQGDYNLSNDEMIVPFLNKLVFDIGPLDILDLRNFLELYWAPNRVEGIILEFMHGGPMPDPQAVAEFDPEGKVSELAIDFEPDDEDEEFELVFEDDDEEDIIPVEIEVYHLEVNEVVLREIHWSAANEVIEAVQKLDACTDPDDEVQIRKGMKVNIAIKLECERLLPELQGEFIDAFLQ